MPKRIPKGARVTAESQPQLAALIADVAREAAVEAPDEVLVHLAPEVRLVEARRGRRVLVLGLPVLGLVSERALRAVVRHEFAGGASDDVYAATLQQLEAHAPAWGAYWGRARHACARGRAPAAIARRFAAFLRTAPVEPSAVADPDGTPPAAQLLAGIPQLEQEALAAIWKPPLEPMAWSESGEVHVDTARRYMADWSTVVAGHGRHRRAAALPAGRARDRAGRRGNEPRGGHALSGRMGGPRERAGHRRPQPRAAGLETRRAPSTGTPFALIASLDFDWPSSAGL